MADDAQHETERLKLQVEIWKQAIASSIHFDEMSQKARQIGLTFVVGSVALAITLLSQYQGARISIPWGAGSYDLHIAGGIIMASAVALWVTKLLDVKLYHRMLRGSVAFTEEFERRVLKPAIMPTELGLTESISYHSRSKRALTGEANAAVRRKTSAERKKARFYDVSIGFVLTVGLLLTWITAIKVEKGKTIINQRIEVQER
jgi:hypothetical protein